MNVSSHKQLSLRLPLLLMIAIAVLVLSACGGDENETLDYPAVQLHVGDQTFSEPVYQYYWPRTADDVKYDVSFDAYAKIANTVPVREGDRVRFSIADDLGVPSSFSATILGGSGVVQDLNASNGAFDTQLPDGVYRVQVDAEYADVKGHNAFVSYVFELEIAGIVLPTPTPTVTPTPSPTATATATATATTTPTPLPPTNTPTPLPTNTPAPTNTPEPDAAISAVIELGEVPVAGTVRLASDGDPITVAGATVTITYTTNADPQQRTTSTTTTTAGGEFAFDPILLTSADTVTVRAEAPGYEPQTIERSGQEIVDSDGVFEFTLLPVLRPTTAPPTSTLAPSPTTVPATAAITYESGVPVLTLAFAGRNYTPAGYRFCERSATGERVCIELPIENATPERLNLARGAAAQLVIGGPRPNSVRIEYLTDTGLPTGQPEHRPGDRIVLFTITPEPGSYIMAVTVRWSENDAAYFFRVTVAD